MLMVSQITKEKQKKTTRKIYIILGSIAYVYIVLVCLHYSAIRYANPRLGFSEAINIAMLDVFTHFTNMGHSGSTLLWVGLITLIGVPFSVMYFMDKSLRKHDNPDTVNGEAHLMNATELEEYNRRRTDPLGEPISTGPNNMILSHDLCLALDGQKTHRNCNILVIGGSGAGKTRFFAAPNILQYNCNFVITDPSGEMLNDYGKALQDNGYRVRVFNLSDVYRGNRYNPFHYIKEEKDVYILVETLIKNTTPTDGHGGDPFWENSEKLLITGLILYLWHMPDKKLKKEGLSRDFASICRMLDMADVDENNDTESKLDILFSELETIDSENLAVQNYHSFKMGAGKTLKSILISVAVRLKAFRLSDIQYLTAEDEFSFEIFADSKQALFVIIPTADTTFNFLVSLMYSQLFTSLYNYVETRAQYGWGAYTTDTNVVKVEQATGAEDSPNAKKRIMHFIHDVKAGTTLKKSKTDNLWEIYSKSGKLIAWRGQKEAAIAYQEELKKIHAKQTPRKCPNHVRLILDEFANIGQIPDFDAKVATIRKYEISVSIILQAISQLKDLYEKKWNTLAANCDTKLFLGCDDQDTIEWLLKMLGKKTTTVENTSWQANGSGSTSYNKSSIELLTIDQVTMMADDECIVRVRGERPYYGKKFELTDHKNYKYAHKTAGTFTIPAATEAAKNRRHGPLHDMKDKIVSLQTMTDGADTAAADTPADNGTAAPVQKKAKSEARNLQNQKRFKDAKSAEQAAGAMDGMDEASTNTAMSLMNSFGLNLNSSEAEMKEAIETHLLFERPSYSSIFYNATN